MSENNQIQNNKGGVKTDEGKEISKYNAQKHMILRESNTSYEQADVDLIYNELAKDLRPVGRVQEVLVEIIANNVIKMTRICKAESEMIKEAMSPSVGFGIDFEIDGKEYKPKVNSWVVDKLNLYSRYQTATENRMYKALAVLKQLKIYE